ncbi:MAG TPA: hypothetical protein VL625_05305 [Patescibacteria group bacterium]|nr:hypothetical protein [Patescibacteria group bacterium]
MADHFDRKPRRKAEFVQPINMLRAKVGYGGLDESKLANSQIASAKVCLDVLQRAIDDVRNPAIGAGNSDQLVDRILQPVAQLKAGAAVAGYPLVEKLADKLIGFLEVIERPDRETLEIVQAFHGTMHAILKYKLAGSEHRHALALIDSLDTACRQYFSGQKAVRQS